MKSLGMGDTEYVTIVAVLVDTSCTSTCIFVGTYVRSVPECTDNVASWALRAPVKRGCLGGRKKRGPKLLSQILAETSSAFF